MTSISETTILPSRIDIDTARERLHTITTDPDVLAGFERAVLTDDFDDNFLTAIVAIRIGTPWGPPARRPQFVI